MDRPPLVAAYTVAPLARMPFTVLLPKPSAVVLLVKVAPLLVEMDRPPLVPAYTVPPLAKTLFTVLLPSPLAVVLLVQVNAAAGMASRSRAKMDRRSIPRNFKFSVFIFTSNLVRIRVYD
jgi:hypothetical protein